MNIICDLDDTLINTSGLNNDAYNYALEKYGFTRIDTSIRIIKESLNFVDPRILEKIVSEKQNYFNQNWLPYITIINKPLLSKTDFKKSLKFIKTKCCLNDFIIYENDPSSFYPLSNLRIIDNIVNHHFNVSGYIFKK